MIAKLNGMDITMDQKYPQELILGESITKIEKMMENLFILVLLMY
jgi:hypothetical protein